jgi:hypothetical protein
MIFICNIENHVVNSLPESFKSKHISNEISQVAGADLPLADEKGEVATEGDDVARNDAVRCRANGAHVGQSRPE